MTATAAPTVQDLAARWAATATPAELAQVEAHCRNYVRLHGSGMFTTEECRAVYRLHVQQGSRDAINYALAQAIVAAVQEAPYASLSAWDRKRTVMAAKATERKEKAAATRAARKEATAEGRVAPSRATAHAACDHAATPAARKACRNARNAAALRAA